MSERWIGMWSTLTKIDGSQVVTPMLTNIVRNHIRVMVTVRVRNSGENRINVLIRRPTGMDTGDAAPNAAKAAGAAPNLIRARFAASRRPMRASQRGDSGKVAHTSGRSRIEVAPS